jgi:hypothetical protein
MSDVNRILGQALRLTPEERALIVIELLATLEPDMPSHQRAEADWIQEVERRVRAAAGGSPRPMRAPVGRPTLRPLKVARLRSEGHVRRGSAALAVRKAASGALRVRTDARPRQRKKGAAGHHASTVRRAREARAPAVERAR